MGFDDFAQMESTTDTLHLMNIHTREHYGDTIVDLFARTRSGEQKHIEVEGHNPYFFIPLNDYTKRIKNHYKVSDARESFKTLHGQQLARVEVKDADAIQGGYNENGLVDLFDNSYQGDVQYELQFLIDLGIKTHFQVDTSDTKSASHGDYRVDVDALTAIEADWDAVPRQVTIDIEVESPDGFPDPTDAKHPVTAITAHDNYTDVHTVWVLRHDDWDMTDTEVSNLCIDNRPESFEADGFHVTNAVDDVRVFSSEMRLLDDFNNYVTDKSPDMLGGWNSSCTDNGKPFDYPYIINRSKQHNVYSYEDWSPTGQVYDNPQWGPTVEGVTMYDLLQAYKKTQWSEPEGGYGLANISNKELDYAKEDIDDIDDAWQHNPAEFLRYNIRDVQAVIGIDHAAGVTQLYQNLRKLTGARFTDCHNNIDLLDQYIIRFANRQEIALPTNEKPERGWFYGGYVFEPELGRHPNAVYPDVWSEYPNAFRTCNMSPETIIGTKEDLEASEYTEEDCRWSYIDTRPDNVKNPDSMKGAADPEYEKCYYIKPEIKKGFMNEVVDHVMGLKDDYDGTELYGPVKQVVNSVWGVYGDSDSYGKGYRLFDWRVAESITLYGRKVIQYSAQRFVDEINNIKNERGIEGQNAYQVGGDTDSVMTSIPFMPAETREQQQRIVDIAIEACERVNESYDEMAAETFNSNGDYIELEIESYAPWLFIPEGVTKKKAKKRYAEIIAWEEGEWFDPPEFSVTGIDIVRSDRAVATREVMEEVLQYVLRIDDPTEARDKVYDHIKEVVNEIKSGERPNSYIARPKGMGKSPEEYGSPTHTPLPTYRGAKYANQHVDWENLTSGDKPNLLYLDRVRGDWPRTYTADTKEDGDVVDAIAVNEPDKLPDDFVVDIDKQIEKVLQDPLTPILNAMHWNWQDALADGKQDSLASFM